jgi:hypothetical protein
MQMWTHILYLESLGPLEVTLLNSKNFPSQMAQKNSFIYEIIDQWNSLPAAALEACSVYSFQRIASDSLVDISLNVHLRKA